MIAPLLMAVALLPSGTYHYDASVRGHSVGSSTILIARSGGTLDVGESGSLAGRTVVSERKIFDMLDRNGNNNDIVLASRILDA